MLALPEVRYRKLLMGLVVHDDAFLAEFAPHLRPSDFALPTEQWLVETATAFFSAYRHAPGGVGIALELERQRETGVLDADDVAAIRATYEAAELDPRLRGYLVMTAAEELRARALASVIDDAGVRLREDRLDPRRLQRDLAAALRIGAAEEMSASWLLADLETWFDEVRTRPAADAATGLPALDEAMQGGLRKGELAVVMGHTNVGKSQFLVHVGAKAVQDGKRVLHVTVETERLDTLARYAAHFTGHNSRRVQDQPDVVQVDLTDERPHITGDVLVRFFAPRSVTTAQIGDLLDAAVLEEKPFDALIVDYADLVRSVSAADQDPAYIKEGRAFEELRAVASDAKVPCWTATQTNRTGLSSALKKQVADMDTVANSFDKMKIADFVISLNQSDDEKQLGEVRAALIKARRGVAGNVIVLKADYGTSIFREADAAAPARPAWMTPGGA